MRRWDGAKMRNQHCMLIMIDVKNVKTSSTPWGGITSSGVWRQGSRITAGAAS